MIGRLVWHSFDEHQVFKRVRSVRPIHLNLICQSMTAEPTL